MKTNSSESTKKPHIGADIDLIIEDLYDLCGEWTFYIFADQWFTVRGTCEHCTFITQSENATDLSSAFVKLYEYAANYRHHLEGEDHGKKSESKSAD